jgi:transposase
MKAYSLDSRQKILDTYKNKEGSIRQVSARFKVSRSFVQKLLKQYQKIGSLTPLPHGGGTALNAGLELISIKDIRNWFAHCCYCGSNQEVRNVASKIA